MAGVTQKPKEVLERVGDPLPPRCELIQVRVGELKQLFNMMDPSPFRMKDLDPKAEEFIVGWAREVSREAQLALLVHLDRSAGRTDEPAILKEAIRDFFSQRSLTSKRQLRLLFQVGRKSLLIGLFFLALSIVAGDLISNLMTGRPLGQMLRESLLIGGWVAMWRPLEIFLYDWWPIRAEIRLFDRLSSMPVQIAYAAEKPEAWKTDWPAALSSQTTDR